MISEIVNWHVHPCFGDEQKNPSEITDYAFDTTGQLLACAFGDHRVLVFNNEKAESLSSIEKWSRHLYKVSSTGEILLVDWKADGTLLAAGDFKDLFYVFSASDGSLVSFTKVSSKLTKIQWNNKGLLNLLLTSSDDGTVTVWNSSERTPWVVQKYALHTSTVRDIQWLTKETFASCSFDGSIHICRITQEEAIYSFFNENAIISIKFNTKYDYLAFCSYDKNVKLWSLKEDSCIREWEGHTQGIYSISWNESDDFSFLASGGDDRTLRIWNINSSLSHKVLRDHCSLVSAVSFSPNGRYLASADIDGVVIVWSTKTWELMIRRQCPGTILDAKSLQWSPQSNRLVVANQSSQICEFIWTCATKRCSDDIRPDH